MSSKRSHSEILMLFIVVMMLVACTSTAANPSAPSTNNADGAMTIAPSPRPATSVPSTAPEVLGVPLTNSEGCINTFDERLDYFPEKVTFERAEGLTVEYHNHYKLITITNPWRDADATFQYLLVQCGTPLPEGFENTLVIEVPVNRVVAMSATQLPHLESLGVLDRLVGYDDFTYISSPVIRAKADAGEIIETGSGVDVNIETMLELDPDLVMTFGVGQLEYDAHPILLEAGIPTVLNSEYMETSPLARSEWLKFTALFFNREGIATDLYDEQVARYEKLAQLTASVTDRPTVFTGAMRGDAWSVPYGGYLATFLKDAGAEYLWAEEVNAGTVSLDFESAFDRASTADYWLNTRNWQTLEDGLAEDERYASFAAFQNGLLFNNNARLNEFGANDYFGSGVMNPDVILADFIKIFHPELLPDHELVYYHALESVTTTP